MRGSVEKFVRCWWAGDLGAVGAGLSFIVAPLSWLWACLAWVRDQQFSWFPGKQVKGLAVVSVGNLVVGGTGKTPVAAWIAKVIADAGFPTWMLTSAQGKDEALLHRAWNLCVPVIVNSDRIAGAIRAQKLGARVVVLDDGFQHRRLGRTLDIVLMSAEDQCPGSLLPAGPYRERLSALSRADAVFITRRIAPTSRAWKLGEELERRFPGKLKGHIHLVPGAWTRVDGGSAEPESSDVLAVCGVARAQLFKSTVTAKVNGIVELAAFADHHDYKRSEVIKLRQRAGKRPIVTTEKDAMKLRPHQDVLGEAYALTEELQWDWGQIESNNLINSAVAQALSP